MKVLLIIMLLTILPQQVIAGSCRMAMDHNYTTCVGIKLKDCSIADDKATCRGVLEEDCHMANDISTCEGILEENCLLAYDYWMCIALTE